MKPRPYGRGFIIPALRAFVFALLIAGCSKTASDPENVTFALDRGPNNLDPRIGIDIVAGRLDQLIFSSLIKTDDQYNIRPDLAASWETPDPLTYIFHLRNDATFHDGRPVTAKDVVYTFKSLQDGSIKTTKAAAFRLVQSIETPDAYTVVFKLKEPYAPFLWNLNRGAIGIVPEGSGPDFAKTLIGAGPFKFVRYIQDSEVVLERNDAYYDEKPAIKRLTFKIIPEAIVRALELRKGSVDLTTNTLTPDMVEVFRNDRDVTVATVSGTPYQYIAFNLQDPIFSDLRIRQAIAYAIDRQKIIDYLLRHQARPATGVLPPSNWAYEPNVRTYPYDPAKARQLLAESGHANLKFTFRTSNDDTTRLLASVLQQQLKEVGVEMEIRSNEAATFLADVQKGNFQAYSLQWAGGGNNDPDIFDLIFNSTRIPPNGANRSHYSNAEVDRLIAEGRRETDIEKRRAAYHRIQQIVAEELPYVSLWYWDNVAVFNKRLQSIQLPPDGNYAFLTKIRTLDTHLASR